MTLHLLNSTLVNNSTRYGGGLVNDGQATVLNSTFSTNTAREGGGILNWETLNLINSTVSGNSATTLGGGGGLNNWGTLTASNSIVANSVSGGDCYADTPITDGGHNLSSDTTCAFLVSNGSLPGTNPLLGPLCVLTNTIPAC